MITDLSTPWTLVVGLPVVLFIAYVVVLSVLDKIPIIGTYLKPQDEDYEFGNKTLKVITAPVRIVLSLGMFALPIYAGYQAYDGWTKVYLLEMQQEQLTAVEMRAHPSDAVFGLIGLAAMLGIGESFDEAGIETSANQVDAALRETGETENGIVVINRLNEPVIHSHIYYTSEVLEARMKKDSEQAWNEYIDGLLRKYEKSIWPIDPGEAAVVSTNRPLFVGCHDIPPEEDQSVYDTYYYIWLTELHPDDCYV